MTILCTFFDGRKLLLRVFRSAKSSVIAIKKEKMMPFCSKKRGVLKNLLKKRKIMSRKTFDSTLSKRAVDDKPLHTWECTLYRRE